MGPLFAGLFTSIGYEQVPAASLSSAYALSTILPAGTKYVLIQAEAANVRWRNDGVAPTATVGMILADTDGPVGFSSDLNSLKFIAESGSPILNISFYG